MQNTSHAVMSQRVEAHDSLDFFPTPPWATRALINHAMPMRGVDLFDRFCWEPACGEGDMARPLREVFATVYQSDVHDYGAGIVHDFLQPYMPSEIQSNPDWIITNPPFRLGAEFIGRALDVAQRGVAMLVRTAFLESDTRYRSIYAERPPTIIAQFVERVPMFKGRLDPKGSTATSYAWLIWQRLDGRWISQPRCSEFVWIPPCRSELERPGDYPMQAAA